jgi:hypothetical protein
LSTSPRCRQANTRHRSIRSETLAVLEAACASCSVFDECERDERDGGAQIEAD